MGPHEELLPEHRAHLEMDFEKVGSGSVIGLQLWEAEMNAAVGAVKHIRRRSQQALRTRYCVGPNPRMAVVEYRSSGNVVVAALSTVVERA